MNPLEPPETPFGDERPIHPDHTTRPMDGYFPTPRTIGPYRILEPIGEGGMGTVYLAEQTKPVRRQVAVKVIRAGMDTQEVIRRFEAERQALALMSHPNIAAVYDAGSTEDGRPYFVMEYVAGLPITDYCDRHRLPLRERLDLFILICEAVQHAHQKAIIHRDLKPSNVLVVVQEERPIPKIIDFGVSKALGHKLTDKTVYTELGRLIGTPEYMSPEQAEMTGLNVDTRSDVYSLGVILYQLLTGALPFDSAELRSAGVQGVQQFLREKEPPLPSTRISSLGDVTGLAVAHRSTTNALIRQVRGDLDWIVMKAMEKDRIRRYSSASELGHDIRRHLTDEPVLAGPPGAAYRARKFVRRHRLGVTVLGMGMFTLLFFALTMVVQSARIARERDRANQEALAAREVTEFLVDLFEVSDPDRANGEPVTAKELLDEGSQRIEWELRNQESLRARLMGTMGRVYSAMGFYDSALPLLESALLRQEAGREGADRSAVLHDLGTLHSQIGNYEKADSLLFLALRAWEGGNGDNQLDLARTLNRLGELRRFQDRHEEAEEFYERALSIRRQELGDSHPDLAQTLNDLSVVYWHQERLQEYEAAVRQSLEIRERTLSPDHPRLGENLNNLGALLYKKGEYSGADSMYSRALQIREKALGPDHPDVAQTLFNLGNSRFKQGRTAEAIPLFVRTATILKGALGEDHPIRGHVLNTLGSAQLELGDKAAAIEILEEALAIREKALGGDDPRVEETRELLARARSGG